MTAYLANQIILERLTYSEVITKRPDLKTGIDAELSWRGREDLITQ